MIWIDELLKEGKCYFLFSSSIMDILYSFIKRLKHFSRGYLMYVRFFYAAASLLSLFIFFVLGEVLIRLFFPGIVNYPQSGKKIDPYAGNPYLLKSKQLIHSHYPNVEYSLSLNPCELIL